MQISRALGLGILVSFLATSASWAQPAGGDESMRVFSGALAKLVRLITPPTNEAPRTFTTTLKLAKGGGLQRQLLGKELQVAFQAPDHLRLASEYEGNQYVACRAGQQLWVHVPSKKFGVIGTAEVAPFSSAPEHKDDAPLGSLKLPVPPEQVLVLPFLVDLQALPPERIAAAECYVVKAVPKPEAVRGFKIPAATLQFWIRTNDLFPLKIAYREPSNLFLVFFTWSPTSNIEQGIMNVEG